MPGVCEDIGMAVGPTRQEGLALLDEATMMWFRLRNRRVSLPPRTKLSETNGRKQTFAAAMAQFEEQFTAAMMVTDFTRPVTCITGSPKPVWRSPRRTHLTHGASAATASVLPTGRANSPT